MKIKNITRTYRNIDKDNIPDYTKDIIERNKESRPYKTFKMTYNVFGLVSCQECNTTNPKEKEICSGCGEFLKFIVEG